LLIQFENKSTFFFSYNPPIAHAFLDDVVDIFYSAQRLAVEAEGYEAKIIKLE